MKGLYRSSRTSLFLLELIVAIGIFAFSSAVCIQLFAKAHTLSKQSTETMQAMSVAQNAAEAFKFCEGSPEELIQLLGDSCIRQGDRVFVYYSRHWQPLTQAGSGVYLLTIGLTESQQSLAIADIAVIKFDSGEVLHQLQVTQYTAPIPSQQEV